MLQQKRSELEVRHAKLNERIEQLEAHQDVNLTPEVVLTVKGFAADLRQKQQVPTSIPVVA